MFVGLDIESVLRVSSSPKTTELSSAFYWVIFNELNVYESLNAFQHGCMGIFYGDLFPCHYRGAAM